MPDILIRGMEMPQNCATCDLFGEYGCAFIGAVGYALTQGRRNEDCPLHELPPHGDLVSLDDVKRMAWYMQTADDVRALHDAAEAIPVVVPAEKGEK